MVVKVGFEKDNGIVGKKNQKKRFDSRQMRIDLFLQTTKLQKVLGQLIEANFIDILIGKIAIRKVEETIQTTGIILRSNRIEFIKKIVKSNFFYMIKILGRRSSFCF